MNKLELFQGKKCVSCGQFFEVNPRVGKRQKSCGAALCRRKLKRMQERVWKKAQSGLLSGLLHRVCETVAAEASGVSKAVTVQKAA